GRVGVVDHPGGSAGGGAGGEVEALALHVAAHARVGRVGGRTVAGGHAAGGLGERHVQEQGEVPAAGELVAVQEDAVDDQDGAGPGLPRRRVEDGVGGEVVGGRAVAAGPVLTERVQHVGAEPRVVVGVQPEPLGGVAAAAVPDRPHLVEVVDRDPDHGTAPVTQ